MQVTHNYVRVCRSRSEIGTTAVCILCLFGGTTIQVHVEVGTLPVCHNAGECARAECGDASQLGITSTSIYEQPSEQFVGIVFFACPYFFRPL